MSVRYSTACLATFSTDIPFSSSVRIVIVQRRRALRSVLGSVVLTADAVVPAEA